MATATASSQAKVDVRGAKWREPGAGRAFLPRANSGGIIPDVPLDSLVANLVARTEQSQFPRSRTDSGVPPVILKSSVQPMESARSAPAGLGHRKVQTAASSKGPSPAPGSRKDDDYLWETDPNGCWMSSFP